LEEGKWVRGRVRTDAKKEAICKRAKTAKGVNDKGEEKSVRIVQSTYDHFTIHKSVDSIDRWASKFLSLCFLLVLCD
jgi:hypothetical protein